MDLYGKFITEIETKGWYDGDHYFPCNEDGEEIEDFVEDFFKTAGVEYKWNCEKVFESCGYDSWMLTIAYIENGKLELFNLLLECI